MKFGLEHVFRLTDPILPGERAPHFVCKGLVGDKEKMVDMEDYRGNYLVIVFYPKDFTKLSESTLDFLAELATLWTRFKKQELGVIGNQH